MLVQYLFPLLRIFLSMHFFFRVISKSLLLRTWITGSPLIHSINFFVSYYCFQNNIFLFKKSRSILFKNIEKISNSVQQSIRHLHLKVLFLFFWAFIGYFESQDSTVSKSSQDDGHIERFFSHLCRDIVYFKRDTALPRRDENRPSFI